MDIELYSETLYESISSNRNENNIACNGTYLLYSRCHCPVLWNLKSKKVETLLKGHQGEINGQHFVEYLTDRYQDAQFHIISTSHDKSAIIWQIDKDNVANNCVLYQLSTPDDNVLSTSCSARIGEDFYSITATLDGNIFYWKNSEILQSLNLGYCCLTSKLFFLNNADLSGPIVLLFLAGSDNEVHVFQLITDECDSQVIVHLFDLTGFNDWVKCLDTLNLSGRKNDFLLASSSQDSLIRVWHMGLIINQETDPSRIRTTISEPLATRTDTVRLSATLETVISGHTGFVHDLCWVKKPVDPTSLQLFSCSADKTIVLWQSKIALLDPEKSKINKYEQQPASEGIWKEIQRFGETGETNLPFIGICLAEDDGKRLFAQSLRGAIHSWKPISVSNEESIEDWIAAESITGHYDSITDLSWEKSGSYLLSSSLDKTCRLHSLSKIDKIWHELSRPQVHGHEINCIASLSFHKFASGAEEKTIRTFGSTQFFLKSFKHLAHMSEDVNQSAMIDAEEFIGQLPAHAQLPALGLSNRGASSPYDIFDGCNVDSKENKGANALPMSQEGSWNEISDLVKRLARVDHLNELPYEEILLQSTLWWETNKIYGHCNELHALTSDSSGKFLASASKANRIDLAKIFIWETEKFRRVATIEHHTLTITRLKFSPDDKYLLAVSRDRTWSLSERSGQLRNAYKFVCGTHKSNAIHERIIWDCCWTYDSRHFLTVSRDKRAILWNVDDIIESGNINAQNSEQAKEEATQQGTDGRIINYVTSKLFDFSIQAVDSPAAPGREIESGGNCSQHNYLFALGFEDGTLRLYLLKTAYTDASNRHEWICLSSFANFHQLSIRRLAFRPSSTWYHGEFAHDKHSKKSTNMMLASGADDCVLKLTKFVITPK